MTKKQFWKDWDRNIVGLVRPPFEHDFGLQSLVIGVAEIKHMKWNKLLWWNQVQYQRTLKKTQPFQLFTELIKTESLYKSYLDTKLEGLGAKTK